MPNYGAPEGVKLTPNRTQLISSPICILSRLLCVSFSKSTLLKNSFRNTISSDGWHLNGPTGVPNSLDSHKARSCIKSDLGPNCLQL